MSKDCLFCKIVDGQLPAYKLYEDSRSFAFLDIHPVNSGHTLIVPKRHVRRLSELSESEAGHLFSVARKLLKAIEESDVICEGANLFLSDGPIAGQEVMHTHLHITPRFENDGHKMGFSHVDPDSAQPESLTHIAARISKQVSQTDSFELLDQPILETDRLILEPYKESDLNDIFAYGSHKEVAQFVPWESHKTLEDSKLFLNYVRSSTNHNIGRLFFVFAIRLKETGKVIGSIDFKNTNSKTGQIDYALNYSYWGMGIMSEAATAVKNWAFKAVPGLVRLQAFCVPENVGSSKVMEKIGMQKEGLRRKAFILKGEPVDLMDYAIIR